jgi:hypothetical protein
MTNSQQGKPDNGGKHQQRDSTQGNKAAVKKLVGKVKTTALSVLKRSGGKIQLALWEGKE